MSRYTSFNPVDDYNIKVQQAKTFLGFSPTADVVEVVRCRDCKLRYTEVCPMMAWDCGELMGETEDNDYCSYGERSENGK